VITALDTSVLLDVLFGAEPFGELSAQALARCAEEGSVVACEVVWAETSAWYGSSEKMQAAMESLGIVYRSSSAESAALAGVAWRRYREAKGPRSRLVADFLIGAHAQSQADRLLTRDRGFFRVYFSDLLVLDPTGSR
jgi:predicted nucleic acid-binding protein